MPIPTHHAKYIACSECNWKGPKTHGDVIYSVPHCPKCNAKTILKTDNSIISTFFNLFKP